MNFELTDTALTAGVNMLGGVIVALIILYHFIQQNQNTKTHEKTKEE